MATAPRLAALGAPADGDADPAGADVTGDFIMPATGLLASRNCCAIGTFGTISRRRPPCHDSSTFPAQSPSRRIVKPSPAMAMPVSPDPFASGDTPGAGAGSGTNPPRPLTFEMRTAITFDPPVRTPPGMLYCRGRLRDVTVAPMRTPLTYVTSESSTIPNRISAGLPAAFAGTSIARRSQIVPT